MTGRGAGGAGFALGCAALAAVVSFWLAVAHTIPFPTRSFLYDFRAFACAGNVAAQGADPYRAEPLRTCEHAVGPFRADLAKLAVPAPVPGYGIAALRLLAPLPYPLEAALWFALLLASFVASGLALIRLSKLPPHVVWFALLLGDGFFSTWLGQLVPFAVAALALAALALERGRYALAAVAAACAAIEPHVALPAILALALFVPRTRLTLAVCGALGAALSVWAVGVAGTLEYVTRVLPAQAASELANEEQYSLAFALHRLGAGDGVALWAAQASYVLAAGFGLFAARFLIARGAPRSMLVLVPAACAVAGGPYVHIHHMAFALPAALVLLGRVAPHNRALGAAVVLLAIPWGAFMQMLSVLPLVMVVAGFLTADLVGARTALAATAGICAAAALVALSLAVVPRPEAGAALAAFGSGSLLPEVSWKAYIDVAYHSNLLPFALAKLPTLAALVMCVVGTAAGVRAARPQIARAVAA